MADGSSAISDWPILDALLLSASGADLVAVHAGGAGYAGYMQSAGVTIIADGSDSAGERLGRGLDADSGLGVLRYADAGYSQAMSVAGDAGLGLAHEQEEGNDTRADERRRPRCRVGRLCAASGGGGWVDHGMMMGELATRLGRPVLCPVEALDDDDIVVTVTAIGAPAAPDREIRPLDYVRALELVADELDRPWQR